MRLLHLNQVTELMPYLLWRDGAPGAMGETPEDCPKLTGYLVESQEPTSGIIVIPGGGYQRRAPHEGEPIARWLNTLGISAFVLDYRVAPYRHPYPLLDAQRAIRTLRYKAQDWNLDPHRIGIIGFSAGGHLAATAGTHYNSGDPNAADPVEQQSSRPDLMILCYPVISFGAHRHQGSMFNLLGPEPPQELMEQLSNENHVTADTPPTFMWHTADDAVVPVANTLIFAQELAKHKIDFALHIYPKGPHGLGLAEHHPEVATWTEHCAAWLASYGFGTRQ